MRYTPAFGCMPGFLKLLCSHSPYACICVFVCMCICPKAIITGNIKERWAWYMYTHALRHLKEKLAWTNIGTVYQ